MVTGMGSSLRSRRSNSGASMMVSRVQGLQLAHARPSIVGQVGVLLPVGLHEHPVDVVDVDGAVGTANRLDQAAGSAAGSAEGAGDGVLQEAPDGAGGQAEAA